VAGGQFGPSPAPGATPPSADLVVADSQGPTLTLLRGDGSGQFIPTQTMEVSMASGGFSDVVVADVNGDGKLDVIASNPATNRVVVVLGDGNFGLREGPFTDVEPSPGRVVVQDLSGDGIPDLIVAGASGVAVLQGTGDGNFKGLSRVETGAAVSDVAVVDVNGDGRPDLVVALPERHVVQVYVGESSGGFTLEQTLIGAAPSVLLVGDFSGDAQPDLVVGESDAEPVARERRRLWR